MAVTILDPTAEADPAGRPLAPRATPGGHARDDRAAGHPKPRGDVFLDELERLLRDRGHTVVRTVKPTFTKPAAVDLRAEIAAALRRGGGGARRLRLLRVVRSARRAQLRGAGQAGGAGRLGAFRAAADRQSVALGQPEVRRVLLTHPFADRTDEEMHALAREGVEDILSALC